MFNEFDYFLSVLHIIFFRCCFDLNKYITNGKIICLNEISLKTLIVKPLHDGKGGPKKHNFTQNRSDLIGHKLKQSVVLFPW